VLALDLVRKKVLPILSDHCRDFIAHSPFVLIGTAAPDGTADVSPKGAPPGFVAVLDDSRLAIPDLAGNNVLDSLTNIVANPAIGLLFVIPGLDETLRANGRACVTRDSTVLDACEVKDRRPTAAIGVDVVETFLHCAKAFRRGDVHPDAWPNRSDIASVTCMVRDHVQLHDVPEEALARGLE
jgi:PPOX class probable FMN-dependent enzyme